MLRRKETTTFKIWSCVKTARFTLSKKPKLLAFGYNEQNYLLCKKSALLQAIVDDKKVSLVGQDVAYKQVPSLADYVQGLSKQFSKNQLTVVINTGDEEKNLFLGRCFVCAINGLRAAEKAKCFGLLRVFVFGSSERQAEYEKIVADGHGCISYVNKYQLIAKDFIKKYPLTQFMGEDEMDYATSLVKEGVDINVLMIGFGEANRQLFLTTVATNQFITKRAGETALKKAKYYIFDKDIEGAKKCLKSGYYRTCDKLEDEEYLPLPEMPAEEEFFPLDADSEAFYHEIKRVVKKNSADVNRIVIAFGSDLENIDMAKTLSKKCKEWGVPDLPIFVRVRKKLNDTQRQDLKNCYAFGCEEDVAFNLPVLFGDDVFQMAQLRNGTYDIEYELSCTPELTQAKIEEIKAAAQYKWYAKKTQLDRDSSLYCCLSLRSKLQMMGLDYCKKEEDGLALSSEEYLAIYAGEDLPDVSSIGLVADGKPVVKYSLDFAKSRRTDMAVLEHFRWNSYMITCGFVPATKAQIVEEKRLIEGREIFTNGKSYELRRHGNLTTFEGLVEYRKMLATRDKTSEESKDVIKYDYHILDDAYWLLDKVGCKIIRRK